MLEHIELTVSIAYAPPSNHISNIETCKKSIKIKPTGSGNRRILSMDPS